MVTLDQFIGENASKLYHRYSDYCPTHAKIVRLTYHQGNRGLAALNDLAHSNDARDGRVSK